VQDIPSYHVKQTRNFKTPQSLRARRAFKQLKQETNKSEMTKPIFLLEDIVIFLNIFT
jgi:hypothetical protein